MSCAKDLGIKPAKFFTYPCRGVLHTPRKNLRRRFGSKIGPVLGAPLFGKGKIGYVFDVSVCGNIKPAKFCTYPCRGVLHTPRKRPRQRFRSKTGRAFGISLLGRVKSGAFLVGTCVEI